MTWMGGQFRKCLDAQDIDLLLARKRLTSVAPAEDLVFLNLRGAAHSQLGDVRPSYIAEVVHVLHFAAVAEFNLVAEARRKIAPVVGAKLRRRVRRWGNLRRIRAA